jgi:hypothetical protein
MSKDILTRSLQIKGVDSALDNLSTCGYDTLEKLAKTDDRELRRIRGVGPRTLDKIKEAVKAQGVKWTGETHNPIPFGPLIRLEVNSPVMNLRDWFAGQALAGLLASDWSEEAGDIVSCLAYEHADCMLAQRAKGGAE